MDETLNSPVYSQSLLSRYVAERKNGLCQVSLAINGISCAGCIAGIERKISEIPHVQSIEVNPATHRASVIWKKSGLDFNQLIKQFSEIGYPARPYQTRTEENELEKERHQALVRIVTAAALGMQVMMIATALYFGDYSGMDAGLRSLLERAAMVLTIPIMVFCARPFFVGAWNNIKSRNMGMDVPVSVALIAAFAGSIWTTLGHPGQIYYESIAMFVFLLLSARFLELSARRTSLQNVSKMEKSIPDSAFLETEDGIVIRVDVLDLKPGDIVLVGPGDTLPADGVIIEGTSSTNDAILTGESKPVGHCPGDSVVAGSINIENHLKIRVSTISDDNVVNQIAHLATSAQGKRSNMSRLADRIASHFVAAVLLLATTAGVIWWFRDQQLWLPVVISTLVIACPCALSLATPAAFTATMAKLTRKGIIPIRSDFLENIKDVNHFVFDKTGTLTRGELSIVNVETAENWTRESVSIIAASLNRTTRHPFARAFLKNINHAQLIAVENLLHTPGGGFTGVVKNKKYALGSINFINKFINCKQETKQLPKTGAWEWDRPGQNRSISLLADDSGIIARFELLDTLRDDAKETIGQLKTRGYGISLLSGDDEGVVSDISKQLGIDNYHGNLSPAQKHRHLEQIKKTGQTVAMIGDGLNDAPVLAAASVSFAMGESSDLSKIHADVVLLNNRLSDIITVIEQAKKTVRVIHQNLAWAMGYNLLAIPAAITGMIPPWMAAIGMSASSLIVSFNALRLRKSNSISVENPTSDDGSADPLEATSYS